MEVTIKTGHGTIVVGDVQSVEEAMNLVMSPDTPIMSFSAQDSENGSVVFDIEY